MAKHLYNGAYYTPDELSEISGISAHTIRDRLRRGYSVEEAVKLNPTHDSVTDFGESSWFIDWIGLSIDSLHEIYWSWCIPRGYNPLSKQGFSRQIMKMFPMLKIVPTLKQGKYYRIIRLRGE